MPVGDAGRQPSQFAADFLAPGAMMFAEAVTSDKTYDIESGELPPGPSAPGAKPSSTRRRNPVARTRRTRRVMAEMQGMARVVAAAAQMATVCSL